MTLLYVKLNRIWNDCYCISERVSPQKVSNIGKMINIEQIRYTLYLPSLRCGGWVLSASNDHVPVRLGRFSSWVVFLSDNKRIACLLHLHKSPIVIML